MVRHKHDFWVRLTITKHQLKLEFRFFKLIKVTNNVCSKKKWIIISKIETNKVYYMARSSISRETWRVPLAAPINGKPALSTSYLQWIWVSLSSNYWQQVGQLAVRNSPFSLRCINICTSLGELTYWIKGQITWT